MIAEASNGFRDGDRWVEKAEDWALRRVRAIRKRWYGAHPTPAHPTPGDRRDKRIFSTRRVNRWLYRPTNVRTQTGQGVETLAAVFIFGTVSLLTITVSILDAIE
jgi:hypothetical protein